MKIGFLTSSNYQGILDRCPDFLDEHKVLQPLFAARGAELVRVDWRDTSVDWKQFKGLIPKACWDYTEHSSEFILFLDRIFALGIPMQNPVKIVKWNMRKTYLQELRNQGLKVGELLILPQTKSGFNLSEAEKLFFRSGFLGSEELVAKPSIGAGASDTIKFRASELYKQEAHLSKVLSYSDVVLQPYFSEIAVDGEYSFFFFGGEFAHALHKKPAQGDFRAHQLYGAVNSPYTPNQGEVLEASLFLKDLNVAYGRVDVFKRDGQMYLIELELIEPYLYFEVGTPDAPQKFVDAILRNFQ